VHLGIGTYTYTWAIGVPGYAPARAMGAVDLLERAAALGVRWVQFADNLPLHRLSEDELRDVERAAAAHDIAIEVGTRGIAPDSLRAYLALAERLGSPILRLVFDTADHRPDADEIVNALAPLLPDLARAGVTLAVENHDRFTVRELLALLDRIEREGNSRADSARDCSRGGAPLVGVCLDTVNSLGALEGPEAVVESLGPRVVNLHIKDFIIGRPDHAMGFKVEGRPAGRGRLDVPWLLGRLAAYGRDPNAIIELWTPPQATLEETIALEDTWARESVANMRQWLPT